MAQYFNNRYRLLDEDSERDSTPDGFKCSLLPPQAALLHEIRRLEQKANFKGKYNTTIWTNSIGVIETPSFGKTAVMIALCCGKLPVPRPMFRCLPDLQYSAPPERLADNTEGHMSKRHGFWSVPSHYTPTTVVFAASSVVRQWEKEIAKFCPHLKYFRAEDAASFKKLKSIVESPRGFTGYNLLLVKIGQVTSNFGLEGVKWATWYDNQEVEHISTTQIITEMFAGAPFARVIMDDFNTANITANDYIVPALQTIMVSATPRDKKTAYSAHQEHRTLDVESYAKCQSTSPLVYKTSYSKILSEFVTTPRCSEKFTSDYINATAIETRRVVIKGGFAAERIRALVGDIDPEIAEMLNSGATKTAAQRLGIAAESPADIIMKLLDRKYEKFKNAVKRKATVLEFRDDYTDLVADAPCQCTRNNQCGSCTQGPRVGYVVRPQLRSLKSALHTLSEDAIDSAWGMYEVSGGTSIHTNHTLEDIMENTEEAIKEGHSALERFRSNIVSKECVSCARNIDECELDVFVPMRCCKVTFCTLCIMNQGRMRRNCPTCLRAMPVKDLLFIRHGVDLSEALTDAAVLEDEPEPEPEPEPAAVEDADADAVRVAAINEIEDPKVRAVMQIVYGYPVTESVTDQIVEKTYPELLHGQRNLPQPAGITPKMLIMSVHVETTHHIEAAMIKLGVESRTIRGTAKQKSEILSEFQDNPKVQALLITGSTDCSGMNIPWATHLITTHAVLGNEALERQMLGRAQRLGRKYNLQIIEVRYEAEVD
jgi:hypothetical protein